MKVEDYLRAKYCLADTDTDQDSIFQKAVIRPLKNFVPGLVEERIISFSGENCIAAYLPLKGSNYLIYNRNFHLRTSLSGLILKQSDTDGLREMAFCANLVGRHLLCQGAINSARSITEMYGALCEELRQNPQATFSPKELNAQDTLASVGFVLCHELFHARLAQSAELKNDMLETTRGLIRAMFKPELYDDLSDWLLKGATADNFFPHATETDIGKRIDAAREFSLSSVNFLEELACDHFALLSMVQSSQTNGWHDLYQVVQSCFHALDYAFLDSICSQIAYNLKAGIKRSPRVIFLNFLIRRAYLESVALHSAEHYGFPQHVSNDFNDAFINRAYGFADMRLADIPGWQDEPAQFGTMPTRSVTASANAIKILSEVLAFRDLVNDF